MANYCCPQCGVNLLGFRRLKIQRYDPPVPWWKLARAETELPEARIFCRNCGAELARSTSRLNSIIREVQLLFVALYLPVETIRFAFFSEIKPSFWYAAYFALPVILFVPMVIESCFSRRKVFALKTKPTPTLETEAAARA